MRTASKFLVKVNGRRSRFVACVYRNVESLQKATDNHGGLPMGNAGPVAEEAVGWLVGIGALIVQARYVGLSVKDERNKRK